MTPNISANLFAYPPLLPLRFAMLEGITLLGVIAFGVAIAAGTAEGGEEDFHQNIFDRGTPGSVNIFRISPGQKKRNVRRESRYG